jgi:hypothetical protein
MRSPAAVSKRRYAGIVGRTLGNRDNSLNDVPTQ